LKTKTEYVVYGQYTETREPKEIEVNSRFATMELAQARAQEWTQCMSGNEKMQPRAVVSVVHLPQLSSCAQCGIPLFLGDIVYMYSRNILCVKCHANCEDWQQANGYFTLLGREDD
jgi:hypothetical protein